MQQIKDDNLSEISFGQSLELKSADDKTGEIEGYGSVFGVEDPYGDIVAPGAFAETLRESRAVKMLWQHRADQPIGVWTDLIEDRRGLRLKGRISTDISVGQDVLAMLRMGAIDGLSIGFRTRKSEWDDAKSIRTLTDVELWEVSVVTFPANTQARVDGVKSIAGQGLSGPEDLRALFRQHGLTRRAAQRAAVGAWRALSDGSCSEIEEEFREMKNQAAKAAEQHQLSEALTLLRQFGNGGSK